MIMHLFRTHRSGFRKARLKMRPLIGGAVLLFGATGLAFAQAGAGAEAESPSQLNPQATGKTAPPSQSSPEVTGTNDGVITPKRDVDPGMSKAPPAPDADSMSVIKPKGTPGGPQGSEPK